MILNEDYIDELSAIQGKIENFTAINDSKDTLLVNYYLEFSFHRLLDVLQGVFNIANNADDCDLAPDIRRELIDICDDLVSVLEYYQCK